MIVQIKKYFINIDHISYFCKEWDGLYIYMNTESPIKIHDVKDDEIKKFIDTVNNYKNSYIASAIMYKAKYDYDNILNSSS